MTTGTLNGIGRMYGPIMPETKNIGRNATITVKVALMSGGRTSLTANSVASSGGRCFSRKCRWMFSTSTMGSSTRSPSDSTSAKRVTRLIV
jgi:hypothetical protein